MEDVSRFLLTQGVLGVVTLVLGGVVYYQNKKYDKLQEKSQRMIKELETQAHDLELSIHATKQGMGGRQSMKASPGSPSTGSFARPVPEGANGPDYQPQGGGQGGPPLSGPDVREPKTIQLRNRKTGQVRPVPADAVEKALREAGEEAFLQEFEIAGSNDNTGE